MEKSLIRLQRYDISQTRANFLDRNCREFRCNPYVIVQARTPLVQFMPQDEVYGALLYAKVKGVLRERFAGRIEDEPVKPQVLRYALHVVVEHLMELSFSH